MGRGNGTQTWQGAVAVLLLVMVGSPAHGHAQCTPVRDLVATMISAERVRISWRYPLCDESQATDTLRQYTGEIAGKFLVEGEGNEDVVAIPLRGLVPGTEIRSVRAFVMGINGATLDDWAAYADLWCSIHWDSNGYPGAQVDHPHYWPIGDDPQLLAGGWYSDTTAWELNLTDTVDLWLSIHWVEGASKYVALGSDNLMAPRSFLAGVGSNPSWAQIFRPGLFIEAELTYPSEPDPEIVGREAVIIRETSIENGDPQLDQIGTTLICDEQFADLTPPIESTIRHGVVSLCEASRFDTVWTAPLETPADVMAAVVPAYLSLIIGTGEQDDLSLRFLSTDSDSLSVVVSQEDSANWVDGPTVTIVPSEATVPPDGVLPCTLRVDASETEAGFYTSLLRFTVTDRRTGGEESFDVVFEVLVDQRTGVDSRSDEGRLSRNWDIRAIQNPFTHRLAIEIVSADQLTADESETSTPIGSGNGIEVAVYDILGRVVARQRLAPSARSGIPMAQTIRINNTTTWPSGVYICRVRIGATVRSMKLVHLK